jgi:glycosyltransferase involved in cell wall biosynthesis
MGCPVITTSVGALGFPVKPGVQALVANSGQEFRTALSTLSESLQLRRELGQRGRQMILEHFDWKQIGVQMRDLVDEVAVVSCGQDA